MRQIATFIHGSVCIALILGAGSMLIYTSQLAGQEPSYFSRPRFAVAVLCGSYALSQLCLLALRRLGLFAGLAIYPLVALLALVTDLVVHGDAKGWAPARPSDADLNSVLGSGAIALLVACAVVTMVRGAPGRSGGA